LAANTKSKRNEVVKHGTTRVNITTTTTTHSRNLALNLVGLVLQPPSRVTARQAKAIGLGVADPLGHSIR